MKYRLKDRELQENLDAISGGDFSKRLQDPAKSEKGFAVAYGDFPEINGLRHLSLFLADEIEEAPEYDPTRWNVWPNVEPPEDVGMQIEIVQLDPSGKPLKLPRFCGHSTFRNNYWYNIGHVDNDEIVRFRPWDDPDEEDEE